MARDREGQTFCRNSIGLNLLLDCSAWSGKVFIYCNIDGRHPDEVPHILCSHCGSLGLSYTSLGCDDTPGKPPCFFGIVRDVSFFCLDPFRNSQTILCFVVPLFSVQRFTSRINSPLNFAHRPGSFRQNVEGLGSQRRQDGSRFKSCEVHCLLQ